jgi:hypothetical protein
MADDAGIDLVSDINSGDLDAGITPAAPAPAGTIPAHGTDTVHVNAQPSRTDTQEKPGGKQPASLRDQLSAAFKTPEGAPTDQQTAADRGDGRTATGQFAPKAGESPVQNNRDKNPQPYRLRRVLIPQYSQPYRRKRNSTLRVLWRLSKNKPHVTVGTNSLKL